MSLLTIVKARYRAAEYISAALFGSDYKSKNNLVEGQTGADLLNIAVELNMGAYPYKHRDAIRRIDSLSDDVLATSIQEQSSQRHVKEAIALLRIDSGYLETEIRPFA